MSSEPHSASWMRGAHGVERQELGLDLGRGAQDARLGVVLLVDPEPGERGLGRAGSTGCTARPSCGCRAGSSLGALERRHQHGAVRRAVRRLIGWSPYHAHDSTPLQRVSSTQIVTSSFLGLVAGHVLLELFLGVRDDREVLGRDAVALGAVAVAAERDAPPAGLAGREHDPAADPRGEVLLEDAPVDHLDGEMRHARPPASP